ncbi:MAG: type 1 glutamine amidotransferase domain-containing protein [Spirochaetia bacterium]
MAERKAVILVEDMYEDMEFWYPYYRLLEEGYAVTVVAPEKNRVYTSKHGYPVKSEAAPEGIDIQSIDVLVVPGGYAPDKLRRYDGILDLVRGVYDKGGVVGMICHAGWVPISAGITKGRKVTSVSAIKDDLVNSGADFVDEPVVVDNRLVSSRTPDDLPVFVKAILDTAG